MDTSTQEAVNVFGRLSESAKHSLLRFAYFLESDDYENIRAPRMSAVMRGNDEFSRLMKEAGADNEFLARTALCQDEFEFSDSEGLSEW